MTHGSSAVRGALVFLSLACSFAAAPQAANEAARTAFVEKMVGQHGFDRAELSALLDAAAIDQTILDTMARPAERVAPWFEPLSRYFHGSPAVTRFCVTSCEALMV